MRIHVNDLYERGQHIGWRLECACASPPYRHRREVAAEVYGAVIRFEWRAYDMTVSLPQLDALPGLFELYAGLTSDLARARQRLTFADPDDEDEIDSVEVFEARPLGPGGWTTWAQLRTPDSRIRAMAYRHGVGLDALLTSTGIWLATTPIERRDLQQLALRGRHRRGWFHVDPDSFAFVSEVVAFARARAAP
jgi:hypothetical protein